MIEFNPSEVKRLAEFVLDNHISYNSNGADWCMGCGCHLHGFTGKGDHKSDCITKVAQDVLTGLENIK